MFPPKKRGVCVSEDIDIYDIKKEFEAKKREQLGLKGELDGEDTFEDNYDYMRVLADIGKELIHEARYLSKYPSKDMFKKRSEEMREKFERLEEKRRVSEEKNGEHFAVSKFLDGSGLDKNEKLIVKILYAQKGVGTKPLDPSVEGEVLLHGLKMISDEKVEKIRSYLTRGSALKEKEYLRTGRTRSIRRYEVPRERGRSVEESSFRLNSSIVDRMLENDQDIEDEKSREGGRRGRKRKRRSKDLFESVDTELTLSDVVLPEDIESSIRAILAERKNRDKFYEEWNMKSVVGDRKGLNVLFTGPPGTGKTMTAKALSNHLDKNLYIIRLQNMINVWYGETEKNVNALFDKADEEGAIILLDEADAILRTRRSEIGGTGATENRMVNIFLQRMEKHSGLVVMTTNFAVDLDKALNRRIDLKIEFPQPGAEARKEIWKHHLPDELPLSQDVDVDELSKKYDFTGGEIRNAALNAARKALHDERDVISVEDFEIACREEKKGDKAMGYSLQKESMEDVRGYK